MLAFLGRPKEKEEKRNFVIKEKPYEPGMKTPEPVLTPAVALKEILREVNDNYQLLKDAKIFEIFAWHMALHRLFYLDHLLVHELSVQKKIYSTYVREKREAKVAELLIFPNRDAQIIKQAAGEIERRVHEKFPTYSKYCQPFHFLGERERRGEERRGEERRGEERRGEERRGEERRGEERRGKEREEDRGEARREGEASREKRER